MKPLILFALMALSAFAGAVHADTKKAPAPDAKPSVIKQSVVKTTAAKADDHAGHEHEAGMPGHSHDSDAPANNDSPFGLNESNSDYLWRRSDQAFHDGDYERALVNHRAIVALDPTDTESFGVAAWLLWSMGKTEEANAHLQRGLTLNPENADMWDTAGQQYDLQKKFAESKTAYTNAVKFTPAGENTMMLRRRLAHASEKAGDRTLALETWRGLVKDFPADVVNKNNLARVEKSGTVLSSIADLARTVRIDISKASQSIRAHFGIGSTL